MSRLSLAFPLLVACAGGGGPDDTDASAPRLDCPAMSGEGEVTFDVDGVARTAFIAVPPGDGPHRVLFAFHGLAPAGFDAVNDLVRGLRLTTLSEDEEVVVIVPQAGLADLALAEVQLWGILNDDDKAADLAFFDLMRGCAVQEASGDAERISAFGFSGGALWSSILLMERSEALASVVTLSGGVDQYGPTLAWKPPAAKIPAVVIDGGTNDAWPNPTFSLIDFQAGSDSLSGYLDAAGHTVATCKHTGGHTFPPGAQWAYARAWMLSAVRGEATPAAAAEPAPTGCTGP